MRHLGPADDAFYEAGEYDEAEDCGDLDDYETRETCWECHGEGGWHDCGEDTCCCLDKDEITIVCKTCGGSGEL